MELKNTPVLTSHIPLATPDNRQMNSVSDRSGGLPAHGDRSTAHAAPGARPRLRFAGASVLSQKFGAKDRWASSWS